MANLTWDEVKATIERLAEGSALELAASEGERWVLRPARGGAREAMLDPRAIVDAAATSPSPLVSWAASFLVGVEATLRRPEQREDPWSFVAIAGRLVPRLCDSGILEGCACAGGPPPYKQSWTSPILLTYWVERDDGNILITQRDVEDWGVTHDRIHSAARSLLYHKSREAAAPVDSAVESYMTGDGYDAARVIILEDLEWARSQRGLWIAVPSEDQLLFREPSEDEQALASFRALARGRWEKARRPLTPNVFRLDTDGVSRA